MTYPDRRPHPLHSPGGRAHGWACPLWPPGSAAAGSKSSSRFNNKFLHFSAQPRKWWKGLCHVMNIIWRLIIINRWTCADSFYNFLFHSWSIKFKVLSCSYEITLLILKILPVTCAKDSKAAILTLKCLREAAWDYVRVNHTGHRLEEVNSCAFSPQLMRGRH